MGAVVLRLAHLTFDRKVIDSTKFVFSHFTPPVSRKPLLKTKLTKLEGSRVIDLGVIMLVINTCNETDLMTICLAGSGHLWTLLTLPSTVAPLPCRYSSLSSRDTNDNFDRDDLDLFFLFYFFKRNLRDLLHN